MNRLFVDSNIFLDVALNDRPEQPYARMLLEEFLYSEADGFVAASSLADIYYLLNKASSEPYARNAIRKIMDIVEVTSVNSFICETAVNSNEPDFEDGIVRACAESIDADFIITRDTEAYKKCPIRALTAQEYLELFCGVEKVEI